MMICPICKDPLSKTKERGTYECPTCQITVKIIPPQ